MLDYDPNIAAGASRAPSYGGQWAVDLGSQGLPPDENLLLGLVAAFREADFGTGDAKRAASRRVSYEFQPERTSGYCASS